MRTVLLHHGNFRNGFRKLNAFHSEVKSVFKTFNQTSWRLTPPCAELSSRIDIGAANTGVRAFVTAFLPGIIPHIQNHHFRFLRLLKIDTWNFDVVAGSGFDSQWGLWIYFLNFSNLSSRTMALELTQPPTDMSTINLVKLCRRVMLTNSPPSANRFSRNCGILNDSQIYSPSQPVTGIALLYFTLII
jgi:hypothetical protein